MLHFLVTHVRDTRGKASSEATAKAMTGNSSQLATTGKSPADTVKQARRWATAPGHPIGADVDSQGNVLAKQPAAVTRLSLLGAVVSLAAISGCACLHRDKVDANVVSARQLSLRGIDAMQRDQWNDAETLFAEALRKNPADERAHQHFAELLWRRGQQQVAIRHQE